MIGGLYSLNLLLAFIKHISRGHIDIEDNVRPVTSSGSGEAFVVGLAAPSGNEPANSKSRL